MVPEFIIYVAYNIADPSRIRYVGLTRRGLLERVKAHWKTSRSSKVRRPLYYWMRKHGDAVTFDVLEVLNTEAEMKAAEIRWIAHYRSIGQADLNITDGGESANGYRHTEETRKRISDYLKANPNRHSPAEWHRKAVGDANRKRLHTEEGRVAHIESIGTLTIAQVSEIKERLWRGESQKAMAGDYGISFQTINNISRGISWDIVPWPIGPRKKPELPPVPKGSASPNSKLTEGDVIEIRRTAKRGNYPKIAGQYGISVASVSNIVNRKSWKHVD